MRLLAKMCFLRKISKKIVADLKERSGKSQTFEMYGGILMLDPVFKDFFKLLDLGPYHYLAIGL